MFFYESLDGVLNEQLILDLDSMSVIMSFYDFDVLKKIQS